MRYDMINFTKHHFVQIFFHHDNLDEIFLHIWKHLFKKSFRLKKTSHRLLGDFKINKYPSNDILIELHLSETHFTINFIFFISDFIDITIAFQQKRLGWLGSQSF